jgi:hypothetical protein
MEREKSPEKELPMYEVTYEYKTVEGKWSEPCQEEMNGKDMMEMLERLLDCVERGTARLLRVQRKEAQQ